MSKHRFGKVAVRIELRQANAGLQVLPDHVAGAPGLYGVVVIVRDDLPSPLLTAGRPRTLSKSAALIAPPPVGAVSARREGRNRPPQGVYRPVIPTAENLGRGQNTQSEYIWSAYAPIAAKCCNAAIYSDVPNADIAAD